MFGIVGAKGGGVLESIGGKFKFVRIPTSCE